MALNSLLLKETSWSIYIYFGFVCVKINKIFFPFILLLNSCFKKCSGIHFLNQFKCIYLKEERWYSMYASVKMVDWNCYDLIWSKSQRYRFFWKDSFVFCIRYNKAVFVLWAKPSLLASCCASQEPLSTTSSWEEMGRLPAAPHLRDIPASLWVEGGVSEGRRVKESSAGCTKPVDLLPLDCDHSELCPWKGICISIGLDLAHGWNCSCLLGFCFLVWFFFL